IPSSWPGLFRPFTPFGLAWREKVDARDKPGHDEKQCWASAAAPRRTRKPCTRTGVIPTSCLPACNASSGHGRPRETAMNYLRTAMLLAGLTALFMGVEACEQHCGT